MKKNLFVKDFSKILKEIEKKSKNKEEDDSKKKSKEKDSTKGPIDSTKYDVLPDPDKGEAMGKSSSKIPRPEFVKKFGPLAVSSAKGTGVFPSTILAQAALESGWGTKRLGEFSLFGVKGATRKKGKSIPHKPKGAWKGKVGLFKTKEKVDGKTISVKRYFRLYDSMEDSFKDHVDVLLKSRYSSAIEADKPEDQVVEIGEAGYAHKGAKGNTYGPYLRDKMLPGIIKEMEKQGISNEKAKASGKKAGESIKKTVEKSKSSDTSKSKISDHIKDRKQGNKFRNWVNDNHEDYAKEIKLDRKGKYNNNFIKKAWKKLGDDYLKFKKKNNLNKEKVDVLGKMEPYPKGGLDFKYIKIRQGDKKEKSIIYALSLKDGEVYARRGGSKEKYQKISKSELSEVKLGTYNITNKDFFKNIFPKAKKRIKEIDPEISGKLEKKEKEIKEKDPTESPGYYNITFGADGNPVVPAMEDLAKAIKDELGVTVTSLGRGPTSQSRVSFQYPYAIDALVRKFDTSLPPGIYYFSNHPKSAALWPKVQKALEKIPGMDKSKIATTKKGVYGAYNSSTYQNIFKAYEKGKDFIQKAGVKGGQLQKKHGKKAGEKYWTGANKYWSNINKEKAKKKKTGHATGYGLDVSERVPKEKLQKVADKLGLKIKDVKYESDHNHVNVTNKSQKVNESKKILKEFLKLIKSS